MIVMKINADNILSNLYAYMKNCDTMTNSFVFVFFSTDRLQNQMQAKKSVGLCVCINQPEENGEKEKTPTYATTQCQNLPARNLSKSALI